GRPRAIPDRQEQPADAPAPKQRKEARRAPAREIAEPRWTAVEVIDRLEEQQPPQPDQGHEPAGDDDQRQRDGDGARDDGGDEQRPWRRPRWKAALREHGGAKGDGREEQRREDRREGPVVPDPAQEEVRLQSVVLPPETDGVLPTPPEPWSVVPLEEPPAGDRDEGHEHELTTRRREIRAARDAGHHAIHE